MEELLPILRFIVEQQIPDIRPLYGRLVMGREREFEWSREEKAESDLSRWFEQSPVLLSLHQDQPNWHTIEKVQIGGGKQSNTERWNTPNGLLVYKVPKTKQNDNSLYEAFMGFGLNALRIRYPLFTRTHALWYGQQPPRLIPHADEDIVVGHIVEGLSDKVFGVTTEFVPSAITLLELVMTGDHVSILSTLIFLWYMLWMMQEEFQHYDLHAQNVLLLPVPNQEWIEVELVIAPDYIETFHLKYFPVLIDYGRCWMADRSAVFFRHVEAMHTRLYSHVSLETLLKDTGLDSIYEETPRSIRFPDLIQVIQHRFHDVPMVQEWLTYFRSQSFELVNEFSILHLLHPPRTIEPLDLFS